MINKRDLVYHLEPAEAWLDFAKAALLGRTLGLAPGRTALPVLGLGQSSALLAASWRSHSRSMPRRRGGPLVDRFRSHRRAGVNSCPAFNAGYFEESAAGGRSSARGGAATS